LLASVSEALVHGLRTSAGITYVDRAIYEDLETLFGWLLSRRIEGGPQLSLVRAWSFGARYSIASFQNDVMRRLVEVLHSNPVDTFAVRHAYYTLSGLSPSQTSRAREVFRLLQRAFVVQIVYQSSRRTEFPADKDRFEGSGLQRLAEFQEDLAYAVCVGYYDEDPDMPGVQLDKHLIEV
jgi:hypothetical protein